jgi:hypothetical protein
MMYGLGAMMGEVGFFMILFWLVALADLILLGIWLWKKIVKE